MTTAFLDAPGKALAVFGVAWILLVLAILAVWLRRPREAERCERCGGQWKPTGGGALYHFCSPPWRRPTP